MTSHHHSEYRRQRIRERSIGLLVFGFLIVFVTFAGAILAYYFIPNPDLLFASNKQDDNSVPRNRLVQISMLDSAFFVPLSILKRVKRRVFGTVDQIDVQIPWPYDHLAVISGTIEDTADFGDWVLITLQPRPDRVPFDQRFLTVDKYYLAGPSAKTRHGLLKYDYKPGSPYGDLQLFVDNRVGKNPAVIRCDLKASSLGPILCEREIPVTRAISARIRFARTHLDEWQSIEGISTNVIQALMRRTVVN
jgi:hypothetical protein